jgi:hypothetical protein
VWHAHAELLTLRSRQVMTATFAMVAAQLGSAPLQRKDLQRKDAYRRSDAGPAAVSDGERISLSLLDLQASRG